MHKLEDSWTLWIHLPQDIDWGLNSYKKIYTFSTLENAILLIENIDKQMIEKCMLFIMKNNIKPIWEDNNNNKGGSFSYKINIENVNFIWKKLTYCLIGNTLTNNLELLKNINGISISPKKNFCIIKLWLGDINNLKNNEIYKYLINSIKQDQAENYQIENYDVFDIEKLCNTDKLNCIFKLHNIIY